MVQKTPSTAGGGWFSPSWMAHLVHAYSKKWGSLLQSASTAGHICVAQRSRRLLEPRSHTEVTCGARPHCQHMMFTSFSGCCFGQSHHSLLPSMTYLLLHHCCRWLMHPRTQSTSRLSVCVDAMLLSLLLACTCLLQAFLGVIDMCRSDMYLHPHTRYYMRELRLMAYNQVGFTIYHIISESGLGGGASGFGRCVFGRAGCRVVVFLRRALPSAEGHPFTRTRASVQAHLGLRSTIRVWLVPSSPPPLLVLQLCCTVYYVRLARLLPRTLFMPPPTSVPPTLCELLGS